VPKPAGQTREELVWVPELSFSEVGEILHLLQAVEGSSVELEWGDLTIHVRRGVAEQPSQSMATSQVAAPASVPAAAATAAVPDSTVVTGGPAVDTSPPDPADQIPSHWIAVTAPMAGTFYRASAADGPPYVEVGDTVSPGDTVALIEVMKLFTELQSDVSGEIVRIEGAESALVEFGEPLVWISPA
jgi:acetyl-CoA carboxylase biotin carboxyl carrier protein